MKVFVDVSNKMFLFLCRFFYYFKFDVGKKFKLYYIFIVIKFKKVKYLWIFYVN